MSVEDTKKSGGPGVGSSRRIVTGALAAGAGLLLLIAGALAVLAANLRWGEPCAGSYDDPGCLAVQDHQYDYVLPTDPWVPVLGAAELAGVSYLLVAVSMGLMFATTRASVLGRCAQAGLVALSAFVGVVTLASGRAGEPVEPAVVMPFVGLLWVFASPVLLVFLYGHWVQDNRFDGPIPAKAWLGWSIVLGLATPLLEYFLIAGVIGYTSHDTHPWTGAWVGAMFVLAGLFVLIGLGWRVVRSSARS